MSDAATDQLPVSHEIDGRILTGVGSTQDALEAVMERHHPQESESDSVEAPQTPDAAPAASEPQQPKQSRGQKRFDELTREREEEKRQRLAVERERDELRARLEASSRPQPVPPPQPTTRPTQPQKPKWSDFEGKIGTDFQTWGDAQDAFTDAREAYLTQSLDLDARIGHRIEADRASRTFSDTLKTVGDRGREAYPDFDAVLTTGPGVKIDLAPSLPAAQARVQRIVRLPNGEHIMYAIARDEQVARRISQMDDVDFGMLLHSLAPAQAVASPASTPATGSPSVPAPYQPVGAGRTTTAVPSSELPKTAGFDFDKSGYREKRAKERGIRR